MVKIGIIGGSGLDDPKLLTDFEEKEIDTPYGKPSSKITCGKINNINVCILARHGKKHTITPTNVNNRANIQSLKMLGCTHIIATTACGSLREEIKRGDFVILDQFIDFTRLRKLSFFDEFPGGLENAKHTSIEKPFSEYLRQKLILSCDKLGLRYHPDGTVVTIEGPRFSTIAESNMFRLWGADVINMSIAPEAILAREAGIEYSAIAMSTDYDCWKQDEEPVTWPEIVKIFSKNVENVKKLLLKTIESFNEENITYLNFNKKKEITDTDYIKSKIRTVPNYPRPGIMFRDITTLLADPEGMNKVMEILYNRYFDKKIDVICGIESRGFIIGAILASKLGVGFVPIRKKGKLPFEVVREEYSLEYGTDIIEMHKDAINYGQKVLVVDDLVATGGTLLAACNLVRKLGGDVLECVSVVDLPELKGREKIEKAGYKVFSIVEFEGE